MSCSIQYRVWREYELWVMEVAVIRIAWLRQQRVPLEKICECIVETVHERVAAWGRRMTVDLHVMFSDTASLEGLLLATIRHPDIIVSGDNVLDDFQLLLPFNTRLKHAAKTNPVQVHFDLYGEYWGRNFIPTSALSQYAENIEEARRIGAEYVSGNIATIHDRWIPHVNVLPSRRGSYPALAHVKNTEPLPFDLDIICRETLGAFNTEFFYRRV